MQMVEAGGVEPPSHGRSSSRDYMLIRRRVFRSALTPRLDGRRVVRMKYFGGERADSAHHLTCFGVRPGKQVSPGDVAAVRLRGPILRWQLTFDPIFYEANGSSSACRL